MKTGSMYANQKAIITGPNDYKCIIEYDEKGFPSRMITNDNVEKILKHNENGNLIYKKDEMGEEYWKYDKQNREVYHKKYNGVEEHMKYHENGEVCAWATTDGFTGVTMFDELGREVMYNVTGGRGNTVTEYLTIPFRFDRGE